MAKPPFSAMSPRKPYILRAFYDWIIDNGQSPYIAVNTALPNVVVPEEFVENSRIILDISPDATIDLNLGIEQITFDATFEHEIKRLSIPMYAIDVIYSGEIGEGVEFEPEEAYEMIIEKARSAQKTSPQKSHLRLIK